MTLKNTENIQQKDDSQLIAQYLQGDEESLNVLIKQYLKGVYGFVYHFVNNAAEAQDLTQETFVRVWRNLKKFDRNKSFKTWIFAIAKNSALDYLKRKKTITFSGLGTENKKVDVADIFPDSALLPPEILERQDLARVLKAAMEQLPLPQRLVLLLHYHDQFTFQEIAEILGEPLNTVKSRHQRGVEALREALYK